MRRGGLLTALGIAAFALVACGSSGPKRTVDARAEALRFFPADTPLVALLDTTPEGAAKRAQLGVQMSGFGPWRTIRAGFLGRLAASGIPLGSLAALIRSEDSASEEGLPASQLAAGLVPSPGGGQSRVMVVLVTDKPGQMARVFKAAAARGPLRGAGRDNEARIYSSPGAAFAIRDGVMLASADTALLRAAIERRDGDDDQQLDDNRVKSLLEELPAPEPVEIYADIEALRHVDPSLASLAGNEPWVRRLGLSAASLSPRPGGPALDVFSELGPGTQRDSVLPDQEGRASFEVSAASMRRALGRSGAGAALGRLSISAAPVGAAVTVTNDELRASLRLSP